MNRTSRRSSRLLLAAALLSVAFAASASAGDVADVKARGKLVVVTFPLLEDAFMQVDVEAMRNLGVGLGDMKDPAHYKGIDLELMKGFAAKLGVKLEIKPELSGYGGLIPALDRKDGDVAASSFAITPARQATADFSVAYIRMWDVAAVRPDSKIKSRNDLRGKKAAIIHGSSHQERLVAMNLEPVIVPTKFVLEGYSAVKDKEADYTVIESRAEVGDAVSAQFSELRVGVRLSETTYGVAMRKGSDLKPLLDEYIEGLRRSGELEKLLEKYGQGAAKK